MKFWKKKDDRAIDENNSDENRIDAGQELPDDLLDRIVGGTDKTVLCHPCRPTPPPGSE